MNNEKRKEINAKRIATLDPVLQEIAEAGFEELEEMGWKPYCVQALRTLDEQSALYAQGRQSLDEVNALRKRVNWDAIEESDNKRVTNAASGKSRHNYGKAFDVVCLDNDGAIDWESKDFIADCREVFDRYELTWGGSFKGLYDSAHWELND